MVLKDKRVVIGMAFPPKYTFANTLILSFSLQVKILSAPAEVHLPTFDKLASMHQLFADMPTG